MRFRPWLLLAGFSMLLVLAAVPASAQDTGYDQVQILKDFDRKLPEPANRAHGWLDIGTSLPVGRFQDRNWDPGLFLRWNQEVWAAGPASIVGSLGLAFNNQSRFNEAQVDSAFGADFDNLYSVQVLSHDHLSIPMAVELQLEPARLGMLSPFVAGGPAIQYTHETRNRMQYYAISDSAGSDQTTFVVPTTLYNPPAPALLADRQLGRTHFHLGYQVRAGFRLRVGPPSNPIDLRVTGSLNTWYEHARPVSLAGAMISFGR